MGWPEARSQQAYRSWRLLSCDLNLEPTMKPGATRATSERPTGLLLVISPAWCKCRLQMLVSSCVRTVPSGRVTIHVTTKTNSSPLEIPCIVRCTSCRATSRLQLCVLLSCRSPREHMSGELERLFVGLALLIDGLGALKLR